MATRSITALFDSAADAQRAETRLRELGIAQSDIRTVNQSAGTAYKPEHKGLWESIKELFVSDEDQHTYAEGVRRGGYLLTVQAEDRYADDAVNILENSGAVDLDRREQEWRSEGWSGYQEGAAQSAGASTNATAASELSTAAPDASRTSEEAIPIVKEQLRVGKREVNKGGVRVRSYIVEEPVHEQVQLREERVEMERRPVTGDRRATIDDGLLQERTIEMTENAEEAVIAKDAVVTEEVVVRKVEGQWTQGVDDTVRRTEVDVEDTRDKEGLAAAARTPAQKPRDIKRAP